MKNSYLFLTLLILSTSSTCNRANENCHYDIIIINHSDYNVICGIVSNGIYGCRIDGEVIQPDNSFKYRPFNGCIEDRLFTGYNEHIYIVDTSLYNIPNVYYFCDSIEMKNKILKHYILSLDDLINNNFTIIFE
jgi:hypothetical protein